MYETFKPRIMAARNKLEKLENIAAPTIPKYDLTNGVELFMMVFIPGGRILFPLSPNVDYFVEVHFVTDLVSTGVWDWYVNGVLVGTLTPGIEAPNLEFATTMFPDIGGPNDLISYPDMTYYLWDVRVGSTRGGTEYFSDPLSSFPTDPPWELVVNPFDDGMFGMTNVNLSPHGTVLELTHIIDGGGSNVFFTKNSTLGFHTDIWTSFHVQFPVSTFNLLLNDPFINACYFSLSQVWEHGLYIYPQFTSLI
jgi:hypothetical protein